MTSSVISMFLRLIAPSDVGRQERLERAERERVEHHPHVAIAPTAAFELGDDIAPALLVVGGVAVEEQRLCGRGPRSCALISSTCAMPWRRSRCTPQMS